MRLFFRLLKLYVSDCFLLSGALLISYGVYQFDPRFGLICLGGFSLAGGVLIAKGEK